MRKYFIISILLCATWSASSQIVDDTTKLVYGSKTTDIFYERNIKDNITEEFHPDTTLYRNERFSVRGKENNRYQDLGNNGTALQSKFYPLATQIGKTSGYNAYDYYMLTPDELAYYDTKSPYMNVGVIFGGNERAVVDFSYARSKKERFTIGFDIHKIVSGRQLDYKTISDKHVKSNVFDIYTRYKAEKIPYLILANVVSFNHRVAELGGISVSEDAARADMFLYKDASVFLSDAKASDKRYNIHIYQELEWKKQFQLYHQLDIGRQQNTFSDDLTTSEINNYYGSPLISEDEVNNVAEFKYMTNEAGIKGELASVFYRFYLKRRDYDFSYNYLNPVDHTGENYLGGYTRFTWKDKFNVEGEMEYLQSGEYKLAGRLNSNLLYASYTSVRAKAPIFYEQYYGNFHEWEQELKATFSNEIKGGIRLKYKGILLEPIVRFASLSNLIYLDQNRQAQQSSSLGLVTSIGGKLNLRLFTNRSLKEGIYFENEIFLSSVDGGASDNMTIPPVFYNGRLFWRGAWFKKSMGIELGLNLFAQTSYYGFAYSAELQHYYLQNDFALGDYFVSDVFLNMKVSNVSVFLQFNYLNQGADNGYFVTPNYPGVPRVLDFGVNWKFYD